MRNILDAVSKGYVHYVHGAIKPSKFHAFSIKLADRYGTERNAQQRYRAKAKGHANSKLFAWFDGELIQWVLTVTEGDGLVTQLESLNDATSKKTRLIVDSYELVKTPRAGRQAAWTWRMTKQAIEDWQSRIKSSVRQKHDDAIRQALWSLKRVPSFHEVRKQGFALAKLMKSEWRRSMRSEWPYGEIYIGWQGKFKKADVIDAKDAQKLV